MRAFHALRLTDLHLGLVDLLAQRAPALASSKAGQLYEPALAKVRDDVAAVPGIVAGPSRVVELSDTDTRHDGFGYALWYGTEAILRLPDASEDMKAAARRIRDALISGPRELIESYATEASRAKQRRLVLAQHKADLDRFPVPGGTMYLWADQFIAAGEKLDELLSSRTESDGDRSGVLILRRTAIALLNRFRAAVGDELAMNPALPRDLDAMVFGYLDELEDARVQTIRRDAATQAAMT